jgi:hypothetical protein
MGHRPRGPDHAGGSGIKLNSAVIAAPTMQLQHRANIA